MIVFCITFRAVRQHTNGIHEVLHSSLNSHFTTSLLYYYLQLPFPGPTGLHSGTCLASSPTLLAVGSLSGTVSVYRAEDMHLLRVISPSTWTEGRERTSKEDSLHNTKDQRFAAGGKIHLKSRTRQSPSSSPSSSSSSSSSNNTSAVTAMEFTCGGSVLLVLHSNGAVTATNTKYPSSPGSHGNLEWEVGNRDGGELEGGRERQRERKRDMSVGPVTSLVCAPTQRYGSAEVPVPMILAVCNTALHTGHIFTVIRGNTAKIFKVSLPPSLSSERTDFASGKQ